MFFNMFLKSLITNYCLQFTYVCMYVYIYICMYVMCIRLMYFIDSLLLQYLIYK